MILKAQGGATGNPGGAGTRYTFGPDAVYGDLTVDNGSAQRRRHRAAQLRRRHRSGRQRRRHPGHRRRRAFRPISPATGSRCRSAAGDFKGSFRVAALAGGTVTLAAEEGGPAPAVQPGDAYLGVYRFDNYTVRGVVPVQSVDPIRVGDVQEITGTVELREVVAHHLVLKSGAILRHPAATGSNCAGQPRDPPDRRPDHRKRRLDRRHRPRLRLGRQLPGRQPARRQLGR